MKSAWTTLLLVLLMLVTNASITFVTHYCWGKMVKSLFSIGNERVSYDKTVSNKSFENHSHNTSAKTKCCGDELVRLKAHEDFYAPSLVKSKTQPPFIKIFIVSGFKNESSYFQARIKHLNYTPPPLNKNIPVLVKYFRL